MCIKYFYFSSGTETFDPDEVLNYLVDGPNDGGIDAVFNNPDSEKNNIVLIQSKYYTNTNISLDKIAGELIKIDTTVKDLNKYRVSNYSEKMVQSYKNAISKMEEEAKNELVFFTSDEISKKSSRQNILKIINEHIQGYEIELYFLDDILDQIDSCNNGSECVKFDTLDIDERGNCLRYEESIIVNISAKSLQNLQNRKRYSLLGMNLRYHVKDNKVDNAIEETIKKDPNNFWYKNNGILIVCKDFVLDGTKLKLEEFSIVNGGQTTYKIGNTDLPDEDFYLQCKVVKSKGNDAREKDDFVTNIAEATNSQKPIKTKDLKANTKEQKDLKRDLEKIGVYYIIKNGDKPTQSNKYPYKYTVASLEKVGKVSLAGILQMPGSSRSNSSKMYEDSYYYSIFGSSVPRQFIADLLKIDYYYEKFCKTDLSRYIEDVVSCIKNGRTFAISCICFAVKISKGACSWNDIKEKLDNVDELKKSLRKMDNINCIIEKKHDNEEEMFYKVFRKIGTDVLGYCYDIAKQVASREKKVITVTDYLKSDISYYNGILGRFYSSYIDDGFEELDKIINVR